MDNKTDEKEIIIKVVFLGYTKGGKTNIITQYVEKRFDEQFDSTIGASYANKVIKTQSGKVRFDIWDTAGQDRFKTLTCFFFKDAKVGIFVYDPYDRESFEKVKWYISQMKKELAKKALYILCENKKDITGKEKEVPFEEASIFARKEKMDIFSVSAKTGEGIEDMFNVCGEYAMGTKKEEKPIEIVILKKNKNKKEYHNCKVWIYLYYLIKNNMQKELIFINENSIIIFII